MASQVLFSPRHVQLAAHERTPNPKAASRALRHTTCLSLAWRLWVQRDVVERAFPRAKVVPLLWPHVLPPIQGNSQAHPNSMYGEYHDSVLGALQLAIVATSMTQGNTRYCRPLYDIPPQISFRLRRLKWCIGTGSERGRHWGAGDE